MKTKALVLAAGIAVLIGLVAAVGPATSAEPAPKCAGDKDPTTVEVGIVRMLGCWTDRNTDGIDYKVADLASQPVYGEGERQVLARHPVETGAGSIGGGCGCTHESVLRVGGAAIRPRGFRRWWFR